MQQKYKLVLSDSNHFSSKHAGSTVTSRVVSTHVKLTFFGHLRDAEGASWGWMFVRHSSSSARPIILPRPRPPRLSHQLPSHSQLVTNLLRTMQIFHFSTLSLLQPVLTVKALHSGAVLCKSETANQFLCIKRCRQRLSLHINGVKHQFWD